MLKMRQYTIFFDENRKTSNEQTNAAYFNKPPPLHSLPLYLWIYELIFNSITNSSFFRWYYCYLPTFYVLKHINLSAA